MKSSNQFLSAMRERYDISEEFVTAGRPLVDAIYAEFDGTQREGLLEFAESVFSQQAATEKSLRSTSALLYDAADRLESAFASLVELLTSIRRPLEERLVQQPVASRWHLN